MLKKLPALILIELLIAIASFFIAGEKAQFGEIVLVTIMISIIALSCFYLFRSLIHSG